MDVQDFQSFEPLLKCFSTRPSLCLLIWKSVGVPSVLTVWLTHTSRTHLEHVSESRHREFSRLFFHLFFVLPREKDLVCLLYAVCNAACDPRCGRCRAWGQRRLLSGVTLRWCLSAVMDGNTLSSAAFGKHSEDLGGFVLRLPSLLPSPVTQL